MFHEYELVLWTCFSKPKIIKDLVRHLCSELLGSFQCKQPEAGAKLIMNHLINTAYYTKRLVISEQSFECFYAFFDKNFPIFEGKHTDWILINEPELAEVTPLAINTRYASLAQKGQTMVPFAEEVNNKHAIVDYNKMVTDLQEEAKKEATISAQNKIKRE